MERSGAASEKYRNRWNVIADWLGVKPTQTRIYRNQHEKFARGYEAYLLQGDLPTPIIKGAFDDYDKWLKEVYNDINELNVELSDDAVRFFRSMTTGELPEPKVRAGSARDSRFADALENEGTSENDSTRAAESDGINEAVRNTEI